MKTAFFLLIFSFCIGSYGQYADTAAMRTVEQNRTAAEGDMYLDTNAKVYKIGLTNGKLGSLNDHQKIDSYKRLNDSLFLYMSKYDSVGMPLLPIKEKLSDSGLQYYTWNTANITEPVITNFTVLGQPSGSGYTSALLNDALRANVEPDDDGYLLCFRGKITVENQGVFNFSATSDDGSRIYIDNVLVLGNWFNQGPTTRSGSVNLSPGSHPIEFWFYENSVTEFMEFNWGVNPDGYPVGSVIDAKQFQVK